MLEAQLATLFRPQNAYCIYVDQKAPVQFHQAVNTLIDCYTQKFPNAVIFTVENTIPIFWSDFSLLEADLECMKLLMEKHQTWKYFINQAGTSLPSVSTGCLIWIVTKVNQCSSYIFGVSHLFLQIYARNMCTF